MVPVAAVRLGLWAQGKMVEVGLLIALSNFLVAVAAVVADQQRMVNLRHLLTLELEVRGLAGRAVEPRQMVQARKQGTAQMGVVAVVVSTAALSQPFAMLVGLGATALGGCKRQMVLWQGLEAGQVLV
jgi:hypothetical protein